MLGHQVVLRASLEILAVGVDEEHLALSFLRLTRNQVRAAMNTLTKDDDACGDAGAVEELRAEANHRFDLIIFDDLLSDLAFVPTTKQHPVRHDGRDHAAVTRDMEHVLQEHEVGLLGAERDLVEEAFRKLRQPGWVAGAILVLRAPGDREWRIRQDSIEPPKLPVLDVLRLGQGVLVPEVGAVDPMQQHVHLCDRPDCAGVLLAEEVGFAAILSMLIYVVLGGNQHPAGTTARVVDVMFQRRFQQPNHHSDYRTRRVEFTALLSRRIRKIANQILVCGAKEIRKFEVFIAKTDLAKMRNQLAEFQVADFALADLPGEVDVVKNTFERDILGLYAT
jgi:hypothetical protein